MLFHIVNTFQIVFQRESNIHLTGQEFIQIAFINKIPPPLIRMKVMSEKLSETAVFPVKKFISHLNSGYRISVMKQQKRQLILL